MLTFICEKLVMISLYESYIIKNQKTKEGMRTLRTKNAFSPTFPTFLTFLSIFILNFYNPTFLLGYLEIQIIKISKHLKTLSSLVMISKARRSNLEVDIDKVKDHFAAHRRPSYIYRFRRWKKSGFCHFQVYCRRFQEV